MELIELGTTGVMVPEVGGPTAKAGGRALDGRTYDEMPAPASFVLHASQ